MFNLGGGEMLVILLLALLVLGPERLPKAMGQAGRYVAQLRKMSSGFQDEIRRAMDSDDAPFRPGDERLTGRVNTRGDEVRAIAPESSPESTTEDGSTPAAADRDEQTDPAELTELTDRADPDEPIGDGAATTDHASDENTTDGAPDSPPAAVTPLRPRRDGDARATG